MSIKPLRVAVIGVSGIGKNHARWFHRHGCEVCAFAGSSAESVQRSQAVLTEQFGFAGRGYADVATMLDAERPDAVCISSLPPLHYEHTRLALQAGAHTLCEKPLVYDAALPHDQLRNQANELVNIASRSDLLFGTQMQYATATRKLLEMTGQNADEIEEFAVVMETKNLKHGRTYESIWIDLSPHPISVLQQLAAAAELEIDSLQVDLREQETDARCRARRPDGTTVAAHFAVRYNPDSAVPARTFALNGKTIAYAGRKDATGEFRTYLTDESGNSEELPDLVDSLIGNFVDACRGGAELIVTGAHGAQNVDWQLRILEQASRS